MYTHPGIYYLYPAFISIENAVNYGILMEFDKTEYKYTIHHCKL